MPIGCVVSSVRLQANARMLVALASLAVLATLTGACASTGGTPRPRPFPTPRGRPAPKPAPAPGPERSPVTSDTAPALPDAGTAPPAVTSSVPDPGPPRSVASAITALAMALRGTPYRNGGTDPTGFDCSGFTQFVFSERGLALPREVREQFRMGKPVKPDKIEPGDLLFFSTIEPGASHVAIALDSDQFVHAPSSSGVVRVERLTSSYWSRRFIGARRVTEPAN